MLNLEKKIYKNTPLIVANSRTVKDQIIKHYAVPEEKIIIIYNGVDLSRFTPENKDRWRENVRKSLNISDHSKVLLFVGSGFKRKGLKPLLYSFPLIKNEDIKLLVIGKGDRKRYTTLAEKYGVSDKVIFLKPQREIEKFYAAADIFILPSLYDPFSNATLEAMAAGLPVITTKNNGVAELIENGHEGFVLNNLSDAEELADKIQLTLRNLKVIGEKAREKAEAFPIERAAQEFTEEIKNILAEKLRGIER